MQTFMFDTFDIQFIFIFFMASRRVGDGHVFFVLYRFDIVSSGKQKACILINFR